MVNSAIAGSVNTPPPCPPRRAPIDHLKNVAAIQGEVGNLAGRHQFRHAVGFGVNHRGLALNRDRLGHRADFQFEVHPLRVTHGQLDVGVDEGLETLSLRPQRVEAGLEVRDRVEALGIRWAGGGDASSLVRCRHRGAGNDCARGIAHQTGKGSSHLR